MSEANPRASLELSFPVASDLSSSRYRVVTLSSGNLVANATATVPSLGVLQDKPDGSSNATVGRVMLYGVTKAVSDGSITEMCVCVPTTGGKVKIQDASDQVGIGVALQAAAADGDIFDMLIARQEVTTD